MSGQEKFNSIIRHLIKKYPTEYVTDEFKNIFYRFHYPDASKDRIKIDYDPAYSLGRFGRQANSWITIDGGYYPDSNKRILKKINIEKADPEKVHAKVRDVVLELGGIKKTKTEKELKKQDIIMFFNSIGFKAEKKYKDEINVEMGTRTFNEVIMKPYYSSDYKKGGFEATLKRDYRLRNKNDIKEFANLLDKLDKFKN